MTEKISFDTIVNLFDKYKDNLSEINKLTATNPVKNDVKNGTSTSKTESKSSGNSKSKSEDDYQNTDFKDDDDVGKITNINKSSTTPTLTLGMDTSSTEIKTTDSSKTDDKALASEKNNKTNNNNKETEESNNASTKTINLTSDDTASNNKDTDNTTVASDNTKTNDSKSDSNNANNDNKYANLNEFKNLFAGNKKLDEVLNKYGYEKLFEAVDENSNGTVTQEELNEFNKTMNLEKLAGFTDEEVKTLADKLGIKIDEDSSGDNSKDKGEVSKDELKKIISDKLLNNNQTTPAQAAANTAAASTPKTTSTGSSGGGGSYSGGSSGGSGSSGTKATGLKAMSLDELKKEQTTRQGKVDDANKDIKAVNDGSNEKVKEAVKQSDEKQKAYEEILEKDDKVSKELKEKQKKNTEDIKKKEETDTKYKNAIVDDKAKVKEAEAKVKSIDSQIEALKAAKESLPEKTDKNKDKHTEIDEKKAAIDKQIKEEENNKKNAENEKKNAEAKQKDDETNKKENERSLSRLKNERKAIEKEIQETASDKTKEALKAWQEARDNIDTVKASEMKTAEGALSDAEKNLDEVNKVIDEKEAAKTALEYGMGGRGDEIVEFAQKFDGLSESEMYQYMDVLNSGQWCADFVTFVTKNIYGNDVPGNLLEECSNLSTCYGYGTWAQSHGILMDARCTEYDKSQVQPGDYILFNTDGGEWRHIGIVASVDSDGTIHTIEGNTGGGEVGGRTVDASDTDVSFVLMSKL